MERKGNRLIEETSPYLLQHAHNPVDWYPWGDEALKRAKMEQKPILLSIGYAACHWCHVMEHESFEDEDTAAFMNENFVCIKVDREERPDVDAIYMDAVQVMTGHGGWPMTVFLTPDQVPFFGGTYFPPTDRGGLPSFRRVLEGVAEAWRERREEAVSQATRLHEHLQSMAKPAPSREPLDDSLITRGAALILENFDERYGGFGGPPKFPQASVLDFMLRATARGVPDLRSPLERTLEHMALGGVYDHIGGGFHRYAVDAAWLVPHFEKMLYDNALLARVYTRAWQAWKQPLMKRTAIETLEYLLRDMRDSDGGFFSSEDADSEGEEGKFYVWEYDAFMAIAPDAAEYYSVTKEGNWEGRNILTGRKEDPSPEAREKLLEARGSRERPGLDDKILASWNGLAIAAMAEAGTVFNRPDFVDAARRAASFVLNRMSDDQGGLRHSFREGRATVTGMLEDYAYLSDGLLSLWESTFEIEWLEACRKLAEAMLSRFWDETEDGMFTTASDHEQLILRQKEVAESATPSPNAIASLVLQRLAVLTGDENYARRGRDALRVARLYMERAPQATASSLSALDFYLSTPKEIVIAGDLQSAEARSLLDVVWSRYLPNRVMASAAPGLETLLTQGKEPLNGSPAAYVCENYTCKAPTSDPAELAAQLS